MNIPPDQAADTPREIGLFDKMIIAAIHRFFPRYGDLDALSMILEGLTDEHGQEKVRFPEFVRPQLLKIQWEIERSYNSKCSFLVGRVRTDIQNILEQFTDLDAQKTLEEIRVLAEVNDL